ncbi:MAG: DUF4129 domain-containing protein [Anaerolineae bacterium]
MIKINKVRALFFLVMAVTSLLLLSSGLSRVIPNTLWVTPNFASDADSAAVKSAEDTLLEASSRATSSVLRMLFLSTIIVMPVALFFALLSREVRRALLHEIKRAVPLFITIIAFAYLIPRLNFKNPRPSTLAAGSEMPAWIASPTVLVSFLISFTLLTLILGVGWVVWRRTRPSALARIAIETEATIHELRTGRHFRNVIIEYYARMCRILREQRRLERTTSMTPREFAHRLNVLGVGGAEAQRLTRLFEAVRYGAQSPGKREEQEAIECLSAIARAAASSRQAPGI